MRKSCLANPNERANRRVQPTASLASLAPRAADAHTVGHSYFT